MNCKKCGRAIDKGSKYCNYCGTKLKNMAVIIGISLAVVCLLLAGVVLIGKDKIFKPKEKEYKPVEVLNRLERKAEDKSSTWKRYKESDAVSDKVEDNFILLDDFINIDGKLILRYKNLNTGNFDAKISVDYKDAEGNIIETQKSSYSDCVPLSDCVFSVPAPVKKSSYESYDIHVEFVTYNYQYTFADFYKQFEIKTSDDGKNITAKVTNIGEDKFAFPNVCVAYFLGDELKDADCVSESINPGDTVTIKFDNYYFNKKYKGFNFDNYKVFINR